MRKLVLAASLILPACTHTTVDVGADGGHPTGGGLTRFTGNDSSCPSSPPPEGENVCNQEWQSCAYRWTENGEGNYVGCTCFEKNSSVKMWDCRRNGGAIYGCPMQQPVAGTACGPDAQGWCEYPPHVLCQCDPNPGALWTCGDLGFNPDFATAGPASVPEGKPVKDLTDAEARTWCEWLLNITGPRTNPPERPVSSDGYATGFGSTMNPNFYAAACMPMLIPISQCVANLKIAPCEATVAEMNDCALTIVRSLPAPHGCGRFHERHCEDSIFHPYLGLDTVDAGAGCNALKVR